MKGSTPHFYIITVGFRCNNNCLMCSVDSFRRKFSDRTTKDIAEELRRGRKLGFECVEFTGGEPTVRPDFLALVGEAKRSGYRIINVGTNGRLFSYPEFCREAFKKGLTGVMFSLHGSTPHLHDAITRTPGAFKQTAAGIRNVLKESSMREIFVLSVISRLNIGDTGRLVKLIRSLGVKKWNPLNLIPEGGAVKTYKNLLVSLNDLSLKFGRNVRQFGSIPEINFFDFPLCIFSREFFRDPDRFRFITAKGRKENAKQVGYGVKSVKKTGSVYTDERRARLPICRRCRHQDECGGVWKPYIKIFGSQAVGREVSDLARKNKCLVF